MVRVEQVGKCSILALDKIDLQLREKPGYRQPEIITHHENALHPPTVALSYCLHQFAVPLPKGPLEDFFNL